MGDAPDVSKLVFLWLGGAELQERWDCASLARQCRRYSRTICPNEETGSPRGLWPQKQPFCSFFLLVITCQSMLGYFTITVKFNF